MEMLNSIFKESSEEISNSLTVKIDKKLSKNTNHHSINKIKRLEFIDLKKDSHSLPIVMIPSPRYTHDDNKKFNRNILKSVLAKKII